jgi:hypothetical protein
MNPTNAAIALQLLIDLTVQGLRLQEALKTAQEENRDLTPEELNLASNSADQALVRLKASIDTLK